MEKTREESHYGEKPTTEQKLETRRSETGTEHHRQGSNQESLMPKENNGKNESSKYIQT